MDESFVGIFEILDDLLEDMPQRSRSSLSLIIDKFKKVNFETEKIIEFQEDLESFTNTSNIDSFTRTEIMNIIADLESLI